MARGNPAWKKGGGGGNPKGRPKGTSNRFNLTDLKKAMDKAAKVNGGKTLLESMCERAYKDNMVAVAILRKMLPDLKQVEAVIDVVNVGYALLSPAEACAAMDKATIGKKPKTKKKK